MDGRSRRFLGFFGSQLPQPRTTWGVPAELPLPNMVIRTA